MQDNITSVRPYRRGEGNWDSAPPQARRTTATTGAPTSRCSSAGDIRARGERCTGEQRCWYEQQAVPGSGNPECGRGNHWRHYWRRASVIRSAAVAATTPRRRQAQLLVPRSGANAGGGSLPYSRNVRRCGERGGQAAYYEVTYNFRGRITFTSR